MTDEVVLCDLDLNVGGREAESSEDQSQAEFCLVVQTVVLDGD